MMPEGTGLKYCAQGTGGENADKGSRPRGASLPSRVCVKDAYKINKQHVLCVLQGGKGHCI